MLKGGAWLEAFWGWLVVFEGLATVVLALSILLLVVLRKAVDRVAVERSLVLVLLMLVPWIFLKQVIWREPAPALPLVVNCQCDQGSGRVSEQGGAGAGLVCQGLAIGFVASSVLAVGWLCLGWLAAWRLRRGSRPASPALLKVLERVAGFEAMARSRVELRVGGTIDQPMVVGLARPTILLPEWFVEGESLERVELALAHEWSHVENGDLWMLAFLRLLSPWLFFQPLFVWARRQIRADQEVLADQRACRQGDRLMYAEALLDWARRRSDTNTWARPIATALGLWDHPSMLYQRIAWILDPQTSAGSGSILQRLGVSTLALAGVLMVVTVLPRALPRQRPTHIHVSSPVSPLEQTDAAALFCCPE